MRRRSFIIATSIVGAGLTIGLPYLLERPKAEANTATNNCLNNRFKMKYPHGGCTESSVALFDSGPHGKDPFGFYS